ncbi:S-formylglutathione hydrolase [Daldinia childiae]|uniref:S-formylglutathione hydrolase n=1 Tax=Daldinia childiae TaxID=326645 RepID=UPI001447FA74|nr:S-formylglutathione hydrolase [Daldinia childiae]KAF3063717.1 S-formylglutathione hydrolase [Daldinia childiae]
MAFETKATIANFGGKLLKLQHQSSSTGTPMDVNLFLPPTAVSGSKVPVLIYLSGLTCTPQNCTEKGFFQAHAARKGIALVWPDTSPRGANLPGETESWDFGAGAGFYVDATQAPWSAHYRMESYISSELPAALFAAFPESLDPARVSITGHSMGGHGALTLFLKNPGKYRSVSAFAPIANPSQCPWGDKAFSGYLGADREAWKAHDATELVKGWAGKDIKALVDVGTGDNFYKQGQLLPENFEKAVKEAGVKGLELRYQPDYDHSYFFMSTFAGDHVEHAAKHLLS